jgi:hypothetical protein
VFLYGLTQVTKLVADTNGGDVEFAKVLDDANRYFTQRNVPKSLRIKVKEQLLHQRFFDASESVGGGGGFVTCTTHGTVGGNAFGGFGDIGVSLPRGPANQSHAEDPCEVKFVSRLSRDIRRELRVWSMRDVLNRQPFFRDDNERFVGAVTDFLVRRFHGPNEKIITAGDVGGELFFLSRGDAEVRTSRGRFVKLIDSGEMFGEIAVVFSGVAGVPCMGKQCGGGGITRTADVATSSFCETLVLRYACYVFPKSRHTVLSLSW